MRGFKFAEFDAQCSDLDVDQLQLKWQHYTRALSAASTSTAVATLAAGPTGGVSMIGAMIAGPLMHNARKKRHIIEKHMGMKGAAPDTRKKDIYGPAMISGTLGVGTAGIGLGAEAMAVDKVTKIVSHVVFDGVLTKVEDKHALREHTKEVSTHEEQQLARSSSMPVIVPATRSEKMGGAPLKHANTLPGALGASANGLLASASRMRAEKYPLLKEYISSVASQSKHYMPFVKPGGNGLSPAGRNWTEPATRSPVDLDPLPGDRSNCAGSRKSSSAKPAAQTFVAELEGDSYYSPSVVSPIGSSIADTDTYLDHGLVSPCESTFTQVEVDGDRAFDNLLKTMDESALAEIECELELAIQEMDDTTANFEDNADKKINRAFHSPEDVDTIVRRQSTRFSKRCSVRESQYSFDDSRSSINEASVAPLRSPRSLSEGLHLVQVRGHKDSESTKKSLFKGESEPTSPTGTILPAYAESDPSVAPEVCLPSTSAKSALSSNPFIYDGSDEKQFVDPMPPPYMRGGGLSHRESSASTTSSRLIMSDPTSPELVVGDVQTDYFATETMSSGSWPTDNQTPELVVEPTSPTPSKMSSRAMSAHSGMKKVGYFGLEPAAKIAIGGSLLLMGVRPSVQRKMLDKAKSKMGMPEKEKKKDEDDDYRDYI